MKKLTLLALFWIAITALSAQGPGYANLHILDPYNPEFVPGEVLVKFRDEVPVNVRNLKSVPQTGLTNIDEFIVRHKVTVCEKVFATEEKQNRQKSMTMPDGQVLAVPQLFNIYKLKADSKSDVKLMVEELKKDPMVEFAEPNYYFYSQATEPNDPLATQQWYLGAFPGVNAKAAWDTTTGDTTQIIGIIDTGVDWTHADLSPNIWTNWDEIPGNGIDDDGNGKIDDRRGWDFVNNDNNPMDDNSHGTHVAGIAAAKGNNSTGIAGIAWNSKIMPIKVMQSSGYGSSTDIANGVNYARLNGATILNLSIGSYGESLTLKTALENAYATAVIVAAAGNDGYKIDPPYPPAPIYAPMFPACYSWVIGVQATAQSGELSSFSNFDPSGPVVYTNSYGHNYEISAPGVSILSTVPNGGYHLLNGTSMAAPIVSGAVALLKSKNPTLNTEELFARLIQSSNNGILNIAGAMNISLVPDLNFQSFALIDTLPGCDRDGNPDAGETIQLYLKVKNAGGFADSVWTKLRFAPYEDTAVATIIDSTSYIGDISTYGSMTGLPDPFKIFIKPTVANNRDVMFQYEIGAKNSTQHLQGLIRITVQNGIELGGYYTNNLYLKADRVYLGTQSIVIAADDTLFIEPGVHLLMGPNKGINVLGTIIALGKKDSIIYFSSYGENWGGINFTKGLTDYAVFEKISTLRVISSGTSASFRNCIFRDNYNSEYFYSGGSSSFEKCNIIDNIGNFNYEFERTILPIVI
jgi:subtilisin family serine protease